MILVFDLDDTLYFERNFVLSGFKHVSWHLNKNFEIDNDEALEFMLHLLHKEGRGKIFDKVLKEHNVFSKANLKSCISAYRTHNPIISLDNDAVNCLEKFKDEIKYIVTDGNKIVQDNKINALGLEKYVEKVLITHRYGIKSAKPSPYCFQKIAEWEKVSMNELVYIGDNPKKDFLGIKPMGCKTVRINQGMYKDYFLDSDHEADIMIQNINELTNEILNNLFKNQ